MLSFTPSQTTDTDRVSRILKQLAGSLVLIGAGLLPLLLLPFPGLTIVSGKLFILISALILALIVYAILLFRDGGAQWSLPLSLLALWALPLVAVVSSVLSGSLEKSLLGLALGDGSAVSLGMLALAATTVMIFARETTRVRHLGVTALVATGVLLIWHWLRIIFGWDLSAGVLLGATDTPVGNWSDLMILLTVVVLAVLVSVSQFTLTRALSITFTVVLVLSLGLLMLGANTLVWLGLGVLSLVTIAFTSLQRQSMQTMSIVTTKERSPLLLLICGGLVFLATVVVILGGNTLQSALVNQTGINYVEVRPSLAASLDIVAAVWNERPLFGTGPTQFASAWREHKDISINQSIFWSTDFSSSYNTLTTFAVEMGTLGLFVWIVFFLTFIVSGFRTFLRSEADTHSYPYRCALVAYIIAACTWSSVLFTVPSWSVLTVAAVATGAYLGLTSVLRPRRVFTVSLVQNQRASFVFVLVLVVLVIASIAMLSILSRQIMAATQYGAGIQAAQAGDVSAARAALAQSFATRPTAQAAQAEAVLQLQEMRELIALPEPTAAQQQQFQTATVAAVNAATVAVDLNPHSITARYTLYAVFSTLAQIGIEGALERATQVQEDIATRDIKSPEPLYLAAQLALLREDVDSARAAIAEAIRRKSDYTPALYLAAQIEIAAGNVPEAIAVTSAILSFEPQNAARWYQLGVLYSAQEQHEQAVLALNEAVALDQDYANARYVRGLSYSALGNTVSALVDLRRVAELNPDAAVVAEQVARLEAGELLSVQEVPLIEERADTEPGNEDSDLIAGEAGTESQQQENDTEPAADVNTEKATTE